MADVTGPISTLPGASYGVPNGTMCDDHPDRPAMHRLQGETDSFGCEMHDLCDECSAEFRVYRPDDGPCDWCKEEATDRRATRDYEEGLCGPVYYVCGKCRKHQAEEIAEEAREFEDDHYDWEPDDPYDDDDPYQPPGELPHELVVQAYAPYDRKAAMACKACRKPWQPGHRCVRTLAKGAAK